ncbi:MAG: hypothetical protein JXR49_10760 [Acidobacteria bacterium]|nr:hypothetical protein [Acidobacteriota bacterium]
MSKFLPTGVGIGIGIGIAHCTLPTFDPDSDTDPDTDFALGCKVRPCCTRFIANYPLLTAR